MKTQGQDKFATARQAFKVAFCYSRMHARLAQESLRDYGDQGPQVSGIIRDHFPDEVKERLRALCNQMNEYSDKAWKTRPARVHMSTMRRLRDAIRAEVGTGFYL